MEDLIKRISKSKNFYGPDIDIKEFIESIPLKEMKCVEEYVKKHLKQFFKNDNGEVLGYYICKGCEVYKFYLVSVDGELYFALDALPPCLWYKLKTYDDFREIRRSYNNKGDKFDTRLVKVSTKFSKNAVFGDILKTIRSDYEFVVMIYNMCVENPYVDDYIFGSDELYDEYLKKHRYNSMELALLKKYIIDREHGFKIRSAFTNSIISIKCVNGIVFFSFYFNKCPSMPRVGDLPLDIYMFMLNFEMMSLSNVIKMNSVESINTLCNALPQEYYGDMRYDVYNYLSSNSGEMDKEYEQVLRVLFTKYTINKVASEFNKDILSLKNDNKPISDFVMNKLNDEEKRYLSDDVVRSLDDSNKMKSIAEGDEVEDDLDEELDDKDVDMKGDDLTFSDIDELISKDKSSSGGDRSTSSGDKKSSGDRSSS